jgi:ABC-type multidrug transport system ATPase subunit
VTGFLGPNGAGNSTTMRIMVGLTRPTSGSVTISGHRFVDLPNPGLKVGVLLDASAQHSGRTGREILTIAQRTMGLPGARVGEMIDLVSLTVTEALGMRQRLGITSALIGDPEVLILDEPANGLDPAGIRWMRDLLRSYADRGGTVLLSSHLLHEIEVIADDIVMIGNGRIVSQGTKTELLHASREKVDSSAGRSAWCARSASSRQMKIVSSASHHQRPRTPPDPLRTPLRVGHDLKGLHRVGNASGKTRAAPSAKASAHLSMSSAVLQSWPPTPTRDFRCEDSTGIKRPCSPGRRRATGARDRARPGPLILDAFRGSVSPRREPPPGAGSDVPGPRGAAGCGNGG